MSTSRLRQTARTLRGFVHRSRRKAFGPAPRATKDYATPLPVLVGLAKNFKIEKVLELGCGDYSSLTFLDRRVFPHVSQLTSLETNQVWLEKITKRLNGDPRYKPMFVSASMAAALEQISLDEFDLVFVDDSTNAEERSQTIQSLQQKKPDRTLIAIHDFEVEEYRLAAKDFDYRYIFKSFTPQTALVWNRSDRNHSKPKDMDRTIKKFCRRYEPDDIDRWLSAFEKGTNR